MTAAPGRAGAGWRWRRVRRWELDTPAIDADVAACSPQRAFTATTRGAGWVDRYLCHAATVRQRRRAQQDANPLNRHRIRASRHAYEQDLFRLKSVSKTRNRN